VKFECKALKTSGLNDPEKTALVLGAKWNRADGSVGFVQVEGEGTLEEVVADLLEKVFAAVLNG
jgi:hypothetical protein